MAAKQGTKQQQIAVTVQQQMHSAAELISVQQKQYSAVTQFQQCSKAVNQFQQCSNAVNQ